MSKSAKKGFFDRLTTSRRIHSLWMQTQDPNITSTRGIAICTELLDLLSDESKNPNKCEVYTRRGDIFSSTGKYDRAIQDYARGIESSRKIDVWYSALDYSQKRDLTRRKEIWFSVDVAEDRMRSANNKKIFNTLQTGSPKANLWENILKLGWSANRPNTKENLQQLLSYLGDPDPDLRALANQLVADYHFDYENSMDLREWLLSFYRPHLESDRYTALRAQRQIGRMFHMGTFYYTRLEYSLLQYGVASAFCSNECAFCNWPNTGIPVPPKGMDMVYTIKKDDSGVYAVPVICDRCNKEFYLVWDQNPE